MVKWYGFKPPAAESGVTLSFLTEVDWTYFRVQTDINKFLHQKLLFHLGTTLASGFDFTCLCTNTSNLGTWLYH